MKLELDQIEYIGKNPNGSGYVIRFIDQRFIHLHKRRTIPALLTLIRYGEGCESDLTSSTNNISELKAMLQGKMDSSLIQDSYSDANKPFSELWNEEGFTFITNPTGQTRNGAKKYVLNVDDQPKLFLPSKKAERKPPSIAAQENILANQKRRCNFCGSGVVKAADVSSGAFARDRVRLVWDHRVPVEKGGASTDGNYQGLCFYCNKCKWQVCNHCPSEGGCFSCALAFPEKTSIVLPTREDIADRLPLYYGR